MTHCWDTCCRVDMSLGGVLQETFAVSRKPSELSLRWCSFWFSSSLLCTRPDVCNFAVVLDFVADGGYKLVLW